MTVIVNNHVVGYPHLTGSGVARLMVVLTQDDIGLYACYAAIVDLLNIETSSTDDYNTRKEHLSHIIIGSGSKLSYREAIKHFPNLIEKKYRALYINTKKIQNIYVAILKCP